MTPILPRCLPPHLIPCESFITVPPIYVYSPILGFLLLALCVRYVRIHLALEHGSFLSDFTVSYVILFCLWGQDSDRRRSVSSCYIYSGSTPRKDLRYVKILKCLEIFLREIGKCLIYLSSLDFIVQLSVFLQFFIFFTLLLFIANIHYMFWHNWPSSSVQVIVTTKATATTADISHVGIVQQPCMCSVLRFSWCKMSLVPVCGSFRYVCFLHKTHTA
jgi:hypothetical protein